MSGKHRSISDVNKFKKLHKEGKSSKQISEKTNIPVGTCRDWANKLKERGYIHKSSKNGSKGGGRPRDPVVNKIWADFVIPKVLNKNSKLSFKFVLDRVEEYSPGNGYSKRETHRRRYREWKASCRNGQVDSRAEDGGSESNGSGTEDSGKRSHGRRSKKEVARFTELFDEGLTPSEISYQIEIPFDTCRDWGRKLRNRGYIHKPAGSGKKQGRPRCPELTRFWNEHIESLLRENPGMGPKAVVECAKKIDRKFATSKAVSIKRWVKEWKAKYGPENEIYFPQEYDPGRMFQVDFTNTRNLGVTIAGIPFIHKFLCGRLLWSGHTRVKVTQGGESRENLLSGLKWFFRNMRGVPGVVHTDSLRAAFSNLNWKDRNDVNWIYGEFSIFFGFEPSRSNPNCPHENGSIESTQSHLKDDVEEALKERGSRDFANEEEYRAFIARVERRHNNRIDYKGVRFKKEQKMLKKLPPNEFFVYELLKRKVSKLGLISVKGVQYSVPASLVGHSVAVRIYEDRLEVWAYEEFMTAHPLGVSKKDGGSGFVVSIAHLIGNLKRKPRALLNLTYRKDLFPDEYHQRIFELAKEKLIDSKACVLSVALLDMVVKYGCNGELSEILADHLERNELPDIKSLRSYFANQSQSADAGKTIAEANGAEKPAVGTEFKPVQNPPRIAINPELPDASGNLSIPQDVLALAQIGKAYLESVGVRSPDQLSGMPDMPQSQPPLLPIPSIAAPVLFNERTLKWPRLDSPEGIPHECGRGTLLLPRTFANARLLQSGSECASLRMPFPLRQAADGNDPDPHLSTKPPADITINQFFDRFRA